jgi:ABC-type phosphate transport system ATPase subunit
MKLLLAAEITDRQKQRVCIKHILEVLSEVIINDEVALPIDQIVQKIRV